MDEDTVDVTQREQRRPRTLGELFQVSPIGAVAFLVTLVATAAGVLEKVWPDLDGRESILAGAALVAVVALLIEDPPRTRVAVLALVAVPVYPLTVDASPHSLPGPQPPVVETEPSAEPRRERSRLVVGGWSADDEIRGRVESPAAACRRARSVVVQIRGPSTSTTVVESGRLGYWVASNLAARGKVAVSLEPEPPRGERRFGCLGVSLEAVDRPVREPAPPTVATPPLDAGSSADPPSARPAPSGGGTSTPPPEPSHAPRDDGDWGGEPAVRDPLNNEGGG